MPEPALYGIHHSNRTPSEYWGKNQFNSCFPVALACYMRDLHIDPVYVYVDNALRVQNRLIGWNEVFRTSLPNDAISFYFETPFAPYAQYARDQLCGIDLVLQDAASNEQIAPLEIKLTVIPDNTTVDLPEENWSSELVIRPPTMKYCAMSVFDSCRDDAVRIRSIFSPCANILDWTNTTEMIDKLRQIVDLTNQFESEYYTCQKPLLMQPVWKTKGKHPILADNAFDIFVWSDLALTRLFLDRPVYSRESIGRPLRSAVRFAKFLFDVSGSAEMKTNLKSIYTQTAYGLQTDKEFAVPGGRTSSYLKSEFRTQLRIGSNKLSEIVLNGGEMKLSPERRFDQTVAYSIMSSSHGQ